MEFKEYRNEDAIDMLADLIDPATTILQDKDLALAAKKGGTFKLAKLVMKKYPKELLEILARVDGADVNNYSISAPQILMKLIKLMNDEDMMYFFGLAGQSESKGSSGSATANTEESGE